MSDFLTNLAARSLNVTAVIQPRLASLFEPSPTWVASDQANVIGETMAEDTETDLADEIGFVTPDAPEPLAPPSVSPSPEPVMESESLSAGSAPPPVEPPGERVVAPDSGFTTIARQPARRVTAQPVTMIPEEHASPPPSSLAVSSSPQTLAPTPLSAPPPTEQRGELTVAPASRLTPLASHPSHTVIVPPAATVSHGLESPPPLSLAEPSSLQTPTPKPPSVRRTRPLVDLDKAAHVLRTMTDSVAVHHATPLPLPIAAAPANSRVVIERVTIPMEPSQSVDAPRIEPSTAVVVQPRVTPYIPPPAAALAERRPAAPPTIHVTIGRVEVRATPAPARPQPKASAASQVMTLDEYLRQRTQ